ncbi:MAG: protein-export rane protein SecD/SecF family, partial [Actinomycetia bacterium]|nr:protein-export rane protein SecD/SecF family [Actinomycetes bacterium]
VVLFPVKGSDTSTLDTAVQIIRNRVDALGIAEPDVHRQGNTIVIDLPGAKNRQQALNTIGKTAELRFRLVQGTYPPGPLQTTTTTKPGATTTTKPGSTTTTTKPGTTTTTAKPGATTTTKGHAAGLPSRTVNTALAATHRAAASTTTPPTTTSPTTAASATATTKAGASTTTGPSTTTTTLKPGTTCRDLATKQAQNKANATVLLPDRDPKAGCYLLGPAILTGKSVSTARASYASDGTGWGVDVTFKGNEFVQKIAGPYVGKNIAIELDGVVQSAPTINQGITGRTVRISGHFTSGEAKALALVLKYGSLPVQFDQRQTTSQSVSPTLGKDQLHAGIVAGLVGLGLVAIYMILLYRLLGVVVWLGLGLTGMIFFALTSYLSHTRGLTLTLAGITGIIVSVGVTVDSYVVYFERLKDEVRSGKTVRSSVESGFRRSFRTIVAADLVSLLGAVVLYMLASGSVRGFAFFLGLSTAMDLLLAYFFMHPLVVLIARRPALVRLRGIGIGAGLDVPEARA